MAKQPKKVETAPLANEATTKNRVRRLAKHLKKHPKDAQAVLASKKDAPVRRKPRVKGSVSKTPTFREFQNDVAGKVPFKLSYFTDAELFPRGRMKPADYEAAVRKMRAPTALLLKEARASFGKVAPNIFGCEYSRDNVRALCYGLNITFTGNTDRKPSKKRHKKSTK